MKQLLSIVKEVSAINEYEKTGHIRREKNGTPVRNQNQPKIM